eukprot:3066678-Pyramimonas_sp.AAC.1
MAWTAWMGSLIWDMHVQHYGGPDFWSLRFDQKWAGLWDSGHESAQGSSGHGASGAPGRCKSRAAWAWRHGIFFPRTCRSAQD